MSDGGTVHVSQETRALIRLGSRLNQCTESAFVEAAVDEYLHAAASVAEPAEQKESE
jgi:hypothetical protein